MKSEWHCCCFIRTQGSFWPRPLGQRLWYSNFCNCELQLFCAVIAIHGDSAHHAPPWLSLCGLRSGLLVTKNCSRAWKCRMWQCRESFREHYWRSLNWSDHRSVQNFASNRLNASSSDNFIVPDCTTHCSCNCPCTPSIRKQLMHNMCELFVTWIMNVTTKTMSVNISNYVVYNLL